MAYVQGVLQTAHANWDRVEVRAGDGQVVVAQSAPAGRLLHSVHLHPRGFLVAGVGTGIMSTGIASWEIESGGVTHRENSVGPDDSGVLALHPHQAWVAIGDGGHRVSVIDLRGTEEIDVFEASANAAAFDPQGDQLAVVGPKTVSVARAGEQRFVFEVGWPIDDGLWGDPTAVAWADGRRVVVAGASGRLAVLDTVTAKVTPVSEGSRDEVEGLLTSRSTLYSLGLKGDATAFCLASGRTAHFEDVRAVTLNGAGEVVALGEGGVRVLKSLARP